MVTSLDNEIPTDAEIKSDMISGHYIVMNCLDISKFLREDKTLILEWIELAVNIIVSDGFMDIIVGGLDDYFRARDIEGNQSRKDEETSFIEHFIRASASANTGKEVEVILNL